MTFFQSYFAQFRTHIRKGNRMKILILGGTGRTGKELIKEALKRDFEVNAIVRDAAKLSTHSRLTIWEGDVRDSGLLSEAMDGCQAVLSCLNISRNSDFPWARLRTPERFLEDTLRSVQKVMDQKGIKRLIITSAWGVGDSRAEIPAWFGWFIDYSNVGKAYAQHEVQEAMLANSELDWTAVRPVGLTNGKRLKKLITSLKGTPKPKLTISRKHTAKFMVDILSDAKYIKATPVISEK